MKIIQILTKSDSGTIYGLGDDNNVYMWGYEYQTWQPTWKEADSNQPVAHVFNRHTGQPSGILGIRRHNPGR